MSYMVYMVGASKAPCDEPKTIPVQLAANSDSHEIDLSQLVRDGKISNVQGVIVDNADGPTFFITCDVTRQRVKVPNGAQMAVQLLCTNVPKFVVQFAGQGTTRLHFVNFPVVSQTY